MAPREAGIPVECLNVKRHTDLRWTGRLRAMLDGRFDLVHAHLPFSAIGARRAVRKIPAQRRPALVYTEHNVWDRYRGPTAWANAWTFPVNDAVIAVTQSVAESMRYPRGMRGRPMPEVQVIENGVDASALRAQAMTPRAARESLDLPLDRFVVGTVGGITPKKGHVHLVRAAREVIDRYPKTLFAFVGLPAADQPVRDEIARLGLEDSVRLLGARPDASLTMAAFDVLCQPSLFEGSPSRCSRRSRSACPPWPAPSAACRGSCGTAAGCSCRPGTSPRWRRRSPT